MSREVPVAELSSVQWEWRVERLSSLCTPSSSSVVLEDRDDPSADVYPSSPREDDFPGVFNGSDVDHSSGSISPGVFWTYLPESKAIHVINIHSSQALKILLPTNLRLAKHGVQFFMYDNTIVLCIAYSTGKAIVVRFPNSSTPLRDQNTNTVRHTEVTGGDAMDENDEETGEVILEAFWSTRSRRKGDPVAESMEEKQLTGMKQVRLACWFIDAGGVVHLAAAPETRDASKVDHGEAEEATISCLAFPTAGQDADESEVQLNDTSLIQRLWTGLLRRPTKPTVESKRSHSANQIVFMKAICRKETRYDDTFIATVYGDGKLRLWSLAQHSCRSEFDLFQLYEQADQSFNPDACGVVETAWLEFVNKDQPAGTLFASFGRNRSLMMSVGLHFSSARPALLLLGGSLTTNQISLESSSATVLSYPTRLVRGYRLMDVKVIGSSLQSLWWKPMSGKSTLVLEHDLAEENVTCKCSTISHDIDRQNWLEQDLLAVVQPDQDEAFLRQLKLPGRFSLHDLRNGLIACFGDLADVRKRLGVDLTKVNEKQWNKQQPNNARHLQHRWDFVDTASSWLQTRDKILEFAKDRVSEHVQHLMARETSIGHAAREATIAHLKATTWKRLLQDCEDSWLKGHMPLSVTSSTLFANTLLVIRKDRVTALRPAQDVEVGLLSPVQEAGNNESLFRAVRACLPYVSRLHNTPLDFAKSRYTRGEGSFLKEVDDILDGLEDWDQLAECVEPLTTNAFAEPRALLNYLENFSASLFPVPQDNAEAPSTVTPKACRDILRPCGTVDFATQSVLQSIRARAATSCTILFIWRALERGLPGKDRFFRFAPEESAEFVARLASACITLNLILYLGECAPIQVPMTQEWIRLMTLPMYSNPSLRVLRQPIAWSSSVLSLFVDANLPRRDFAPDMLDVLVRKACQPDQALVPFLDISQQYHVLASVAAVLTKLSRRTDRLTGFDDDPTAMSTDEQEAQPTFFGYSFCRFPVDYKKYYNFLQGKSELWRICQSSEADKEQESRQRLTQNATGFFQAASPWFVGYHSQTLYVYYDRIWQLFQKAKAPHAALDFAMRALKLPELTQDQQNSLCSNIFTLAQAAGDYRQAFTAARICDRRSVDQPQKNQTHLRQLISNMVERGLVFDLCELPLQTFDQKEWSDTIMSALIRKSAGVDSLLDDKSQDNRTYYHVAYAVCVHHAKFSEAASCMYMMAHRIQDEVRRREKDEWDFDLMKRLQYALQTAYSTLQLVPAQSRKIFLHHSLKPRFLWSMEDFDDQMEQEGTQPSMTHKVTSEEIYKSFFLAKCAAEILRKTGAKIPRYRLEPSDFVMDLVLHGEWESAASLARIFELDASRMFQAMVETSRDCPLDGTEWKKIRKFLFMLDWEVEPRREWKHPDDSQPKTQSYRYHSVVLETFLQLNPTAQVPAWLVQSFLFWGGAPARQDEYHVFSKPKPSDTNRNPALLLRILTKHGRLEEALLLASSLMKQLNDNLDTPDNVTERIKLPPYIPFQTLEFVHARSSRLGLDVSQLEQEIEVVGEKLSQVNTVLGRYL